MARVSRGSILTLAVVLIAFSLMACGGSSGGGDATTYTGSTDPATADSTTAAVLAEYGMGSVEAGFPLAQAFVVPLPSDPNGLSAQPLADPFNTVVTVPVPGDAVIEGSEYGSGGSGTARITGEMTLYLHNSYSAVADTWYIAEAELNGEIVFTGYNIEEGEPAITGTVTVPSGFFWFSNEGVQFSLSEGDFLDNPGFPIWSEVTMAFTEIDLAEGSDLWTLGEGDWDLQIELGYGASLDINSMTVEYESQTYKLEDTNVTVTFGDIRQIIEPDSTSIQISGTGENENGTFYHPTLGVTYFSGLLLEQDPPGEIVNGALSFYDAPTQETELFYVEFEYDELEGATAYCIYIIEGGIYQYGYFVDGAFVPDVSAAVNFMD